MVIELTIQDQPAKGYVALAPNESGNRYICVEVETYEAFPDEMRSIALFYETWRSVGWEFAIRHNHPGVLVRFIV